jgi:hypothetical protein
MKKRDAHLERELRSDLELEEEEQRDNGKSPEEARYAAQCAFGNLTLIREQTREAWGWAPFERFWQDVRYALRVNEGQPDPRDLFALWRKIAQIRPSPIPLPFPFPYRDQQLPEAACRYTRRCSTACRISWNSRAWSPHQFIFLETFRELSAPGELDRDRVPRLSVLLILDLHNLFPRAAFPGRRW